MKAEIVAMTADAIDHAALARGGAVSYTHLHLVNKGKWHCKSQSGYKGTHKIVSQFHLCMGKLGKKNSKILTAIIIINM